MGNGSGLVRPRMVTGNGEGLVSHAGLVWLGEVADAVGLTAGMRHATQRLEWRKHQPGLALTHMALGLADGATCVSDLAVLRDQQRLFGPVASHPTAWRAFNRLGPVELRGIDAAIAGARAAAWAASVVDDGDGFVIDIDATLVTTRADKQDAAPTYKRTYGHHPLLAMCAHRGEILAAKLRPGNAGSNTAEDHVIVLADAIDALPDTIRVGHHLGDDPALATTSMLVRADSAGASHWLAEECRDRNTNFSFGYQITNRIRDAVMFTDEHDWQPARDNNGENRDGAWIIELTEHVTMNDWPTGTRVIVRRERPHPGAQLTLFDTIEGFRHQAFITDQTGDPVTLECRHRQRALAEQVIRDAKACGLANLPFDCVVNNTIWCRLVTIAVNLLAWAKTLTLTGPMRRATPKTIRYRLLHTAGRLSTNGRRLDLDQQWPWTHTITAALDRLRTLFPPRAATTRHTTQAAL